MSSVTGFGSLSVSFENMTFLHKLGLLIENFVKSRFFDMLQVLVTLSTLVFGILLIYLPVKDDDDNPILKQERWQHVALITSLVVLSVWLILRVVYKKGIDKGTILGCVVVGASFFIINCYDYVDQPDNEELEFQEKPLFPYTIAIIVIPIVAMFLTNLYDTSRNIERERNNHQKNEFL